jgi:hypothetical protein
MKVRLLIPLAILIMACAVHGQANKEFSKSSRRSGVSTCLARRL